MLDRSTSLQVVTVTVYLCYGCKQSLSTGEVAGPAMVALSAMVARYDCFLSSSAILKFDSFALSDSARQLSSVAETRT